MDSSAPPAGQAAGQARLIAIDVDGTLLTSAHDVTERTNQAIRRVRAQGLDVVLTTSRPPAALWPILRRLDLVEPAVFIGSQGAITGSFSSAGDLRVIDKHPMPLELAGAAVAAALRAGLAASWFAGRQWLVSHVDDQVRREARIVEWEPTVTDLNAQTSGPDKILVIAPDHAAHLLGTLAATLPAGLQAQTSNPTYLEITRADVDKASALRTYCRGRGIAPEEVIAIGDGMNDLAMLAFAGTAVAPANARAEVLAVADHVTASNDADGVARALDALVPARGTAATAPSGHDNGPS
jgi:Cof subfamily protein (haloacid dehalogenase superfamily)